MPCLLKKMSFKFKTFNDSKRFNFKVVIKFEQNKNSNLKTFLI